MELQEIARKWSVEPIGDNRVKLRACAWDANEEIDHELITSAAAHAIGLFAIANPTVAITDPNIEIEEACEEHPDVIVVYVYIRIEWPVNTPWIM